MQVLTFSSGSPRGVAQTLHRCVLLLLAWEPRPRRCLVISCLKCRFCQTCGMTRLHVRKTEHGIHLIHLIAFRVIGQLAHTFHESLCQVFAGTRESWLPFWNLHGCGTWLTQASAFRRYLAFVPPPPVSAMANPALAEAAVSPGAVAWVLTSTALVFLMTAGLVAAQRSHSCLA